MVLRPKTKPRHLATVHLDVSSPRGQGRFDEEAVLLARHHESELSASQGGDRASTPPSPTRLSRPSIPSGRTPAATGLRLREREGHGRPLPRPASLTPRDLEQPGRPSVVRPASGRSTAAQASRSMGAPETSREADHLRDGLPQQDRSSSL